VGPATILAYLAELAAAPAAEARVAGAPAALDVTQGGEAPVWLGTALTLPLRPGETTIPASPALHRLAALDALQPTEPVLRHGWVVVTGTIEVDDRPTTLCLPLMSQPVHVRRWPGGMRVAATAAPELTPLVADPDVAARLEAGVSYGGDALPHIQGWIHAVVDGAGLPGPVAVLPPGTDPVALRHRPGLAACVGSVVYVAHDPLRPSLEASLRAWGTHSDLGGTAFAALYADAPAVGGDGAAEAEAVVSPLVLSGAQRAAVVRARHEPVVVVAGPPGSGKSQTVAAIAADAVAAGRSVLIATRSGHAAGVVGDLLDRQPGPDPIRFGGVEQDDVVARVAERGTTRADVHRAAGDLGRALEHQRLVEEAIGDRLGRERRAEQAAHWDGLVDHLRGLAPRPFDADCPTATLADLAATADRVTPRPSRRGPLAWWARRRRARAIRRLASALGADPSAALVDLRTALECAGDRRARAELEAQGGTVLAPLWDDLGAADAAVRLAAGRLIEAACAREERRRRGRRAVGDLGVALRAGRRQRRRLLRDIDGTAIVAALPLWIGTLRDIEDLLPDTAGLFDLVVLDEASQIDQPTAAGALLRARRAVVVGDPRQLRHVSFVADEDLARAQRAHGLAPWAARLDVRRTSVLDLAAGGTATTPLDEHYRSAPHLIAFSARHFYGGRPALATLHPANEASDVIDVVRPAGAAGEVDAALAVVDRLAGEGCRDIAVVTPFRDVADTVQAQVLARYELDDVEGMGLRIGTVHAFQGAEADHVVLILGLGPDDPPGRRRFVEDPHLFNVMVTRARRSLVVVTSLPPPEGPPDGLVEQYLVHADRPPAPPTGGGCPTPWGDAVARELREAGVPVRAGYPVGRWVVDLCIGAGTGAVGVETAVHPEGVAAHLSRHRALAAAGWRLVDGFPTRWDGDPTRAAIELGDLVPTGGVPDAADRRYR
jgi:hypothetical protein